jgi:hypothetical protein
MMGVYPWLQIYNVSKSRNATENDFSVRSLVEFDYALSGQNSLERITSSVTIERLRLFTQPRPEADMACLWSASVLHRYQEAGL